MNPVMNQEPIKTTLAAPEFSLPVTMPNSMEKYNELVKKSVLKSSSANLQVRNAYSASNSQHTLSGLPPIDRNSLSPVDHTQAKPIKKHKLVKSADHKVGYRVNGKQALSESISQSYSVDKDRGVRKFYRYKI